MFYIVQILSCFWWVLMDDEKGIIMPWGLAVLERLIADPEAPGYVTRDVFTHRFCSHDFLYGHGVSSTAQGDGFKTLQQFLVMSDGDPRGVLVFGIPSNLELQEIIQGVFKDRIGIGRNMYDSNVQITVPDQSVSKLHAYLKRISGGFVLVDVDSTCGTKVNNKMIKPNPPGTVIKPGDKIQFGRANLIFDYFLAPECYDRIRHDIKAYGKGSNTGH
ncbi:FHA domain-containing protein [Candidatus Woesearchaeota archaeon]|nr:FHA domain-containing protein [Candidatus Woesearchaeota archaeon]